MAYLFFAMFLLGLLGGSGMAYLLLRTAVERSRVALASRSVKSSVDRVEVDKQVGEAGPWGGVSLPAVRSITANGKLAASQRTTGGWSP